MRKQVEEVDAILVADLHLRTDTPICRNDDFVETQDRKLYEVYSLHKKYKCPILVAGDVSNRWKETPYSISYMLSRLNGMDLIGVPGNHDLPAHNLKRINESAYWTLVSANFLEDISDGEVYPVPDHGYEIYGFPYGTKLQSVTRKKGLRKVALVHHYVYKGRKPFPGQLTRVTALMDQLKGFDLILTGDNHLPFTHKRGRQILVNPGSFTRQKADQINHRPRIYLWNAESNQIKVHYLKIDKKAVSNAHRILEKERDEKIAKFVH